MNDWRRTAFFPGRLTWRPGVSPLFYVTQIVDSEGFLLQMLKKLSKQLHGEDWTWNSLNTLCWAIGSISGSMMEEQVGVFLMFLALLPFEFFLLWTRDTRNCLHGYLIIRLYFCSCIHCNIWSEANLYFCPVFNVLHWFVHGSIIVNIVIVLLAGFFPLLLLLHDSDFDLGQY